jgi:hypothetical protein
MLRQHTNQEAKVTLAISPRRCKQKRNALSNALIRLEDLLTRNASGLHGSIASKECD